MADDPKEPHNRPPLADKGEARPLTQDAPDDGKADDPWSVKRPSGLHTRPDLYGARAVIRRPMDQAPTASGDAERPAGGDETDAEPQRNAAGPGEDSEPEPAGSQEAHALPAANLLDHPPRIPESIAFEDRTGSTPTEPEDGARLSRTAASGPTDKEAARPSAPREAPALGTWRLRKDEPVDPGRTPSPPKAEGGPADRLIAWVREAADVHRFRDDRWPLGVAAVSGAALLLAVVAGGIVGLSDDEEQTLQQAQGFDLPASDDTAQQAQGLDLPASDETGPSGEDPAALSQSAQQDVPVAPAGSNFGVDRPARPAQERSGAVIADRTGNSQIATLPEAQGMAAPEESREPIVDFMRIDPDGKAVVAGRASPGTELIVLDNGEPLGSITADIYGLWTFVSQNPLASGRHEIGLRIKRQGSEVSDPTLVTDSGRTGPGEAETAMPTPASDDAGAQVPAESEQLAAAEPAQAVASDETTASASAEASAAGAAESAAMPEPAGSAETAAAEPAEATPRATPPDEGTSTAASDSASAAKSDSAAKAGSESTSKAAAAEPEPAKKVQTAAATPAGGDYVVQLASFKNPETAVREQSIVEEKFPDLLTGLDVFVQQVDLAEQGTYYRVRLGPFASLADARSACARFQERDHDCFALAR